MVKLHPLLMWRRPGSHPLDVLHVHGKRCAQSKPGKRRTAVSGWLALISGTVYVWLLCDGLDLHTLGRPEHLWFQNNNIHPPHVHVDCILTRWKCTHRASCIVLQHCINTLRVFAGIEAFVSYVYIYVKRL